jgi:ATP-binding cassette subfamily F protein 3
MPLLSCTNLRYSLGTRVLLDGVSLSVEPGQRIGLVGRNGCGKTTFLRTLAGRARPDQGQVNLAKGVRVGYLTQDPELDPTRTLRDEAAAGLAGLAKLHAELEDVFHQMADPANAAPEKLERLMNRQAEVQHQIEEMGGYAVDHRVDQILHGLGFADAQFGVPVAKLSGGQKGRLALAKLLLESPDLLLLDEPTNHLDIAGREWLEEFLVNEFKGAVLIISHDRYVLDRVVERIEELEAGRLIDYPGNYTAFLDIRRQRLLTQHRAYENQQSQWAKEEEFIRRFKAGQRAKEAQGRLSKLERQKELFAIERPVEMGAMRFNFPQAPRSGDHVVTVRDAAKKYVNPIDEEDGSVHAGAEKVLFHDLNITVQRGERWAIIGPNGAGKTTLVKAVLGQVPLDRGSTKLGASVSIGYYAQLPPEGDDADLPVYQYLQKIIRRENPGQVYSEQQARDLAGAFLFSGQDQDKPLGVMSGGERSRARLAGLLASAKNLIVLDEPTNHLDIPAAERLELALRPGDDGDGFTGTLILISHDRALIDATCDHLIVLDGQGNAEVFHGTYSEYHAKALERQRAQAQAAQDKPRRPQPPPREAPKAPKPRPAETVVQAAPADSGSKWTKAPSKPRKAAVAGLGWMPTERLEAEIERLGKRVKELDADLSREEVYRDAKRCQETLAARDEAQADLERHEEEWLRRAEDA